VRRTSHLDRVSAASPAAPSTIITLRGVGKTYRFGSRSTEAIRGIDLTVPEGSFVSIIGPSGSGKSTLLQIVAGLLAPSAGDVLFHGQTVTGPPPGMIYVFQQYEKSILPWRTVVHNIALGIEDRRDVSREECRERCARYLALVGLQGVEDHFPSQLSGGMQQRVAIARALVCEPDVLLMDEPFSAVDALTRAALQDLLLEVRARLGITVLFVTHDVEEAVYLSTRVVALTRAPAYIDSSVEIDLPFPRDQIATRESAAFIAYRRQLLSRVLAQQAGAA
jgi:NitT/TauT family transport system ATP-binding protein